METERLRYFSVIAQTESVRRASEILRVTPSALSKIVRQLEDELGVALVTPLGRGITLTREGRELARKSETIVDSVARLRDELRSAKEVSKAAPLRIATFEVFSTYFLQSLEHADLGDRGLLLHEVIPGELEQVIEQDKADVGITYMPIAHPALEHIRIARIAMGVYKRKGAFEELPQEELPYVVPAYPLGGAPTRVKGLDGWPDDAYARKVRYEVTLLESALELCRQGRCAGYFPSFIVERHNRKYREEFALERHLPTRAQPRCYADVFIVKRKDRVEDRDVKFVAKLIRVGTRLD
jgi:DNA-binding transcriptional LysR family regulator